jgi:hypothetical protein
MNKYQDGRGVASISLGIGWVASVGGILIALVAAVNAGSYVNEYGREEFSFALGLVSALPGVALAICGLGMILGAHIAIAIFDIATKVVAIDSPRVAQSGEIMNHGPDTGVESIEPLTRDSADGELVEIYKGIHIRKRGTLFVVKGEAFTGIDGARNYVRILNE